MATMQPGFERHHLVDMIRRVDHRGSDVLLWSDEADRASSQLAPYPAFRWAWRVTAAYQWKQPQHITILEVIVLANHLRQEVCHPRMFAKKFLCVLDSQVDTAVITKGRSSSRQLNFQLRKAAALQLAADVYPLCTWALSRRNFADNPSLIWEPVNDA